MKPLNVATDFTGIGAFEQALKLLNIPHKTVFACDMDKYARKTYLENNQTPDNVFFNVYTREIPKKPLDIYMSTPPCQAFSLAGNRNGENDERGILFYNTHQFIQTNKPRFFIIENVKGLLSDDAGKTFAKWIDLLAGKSVNGNPVIFPHQDSTPYHVYWQVLNAKNYGIPQNRERVFIIGIKNDADNNFRFPKPIPLTKKLKDVLETNVDQKYFLSEKMLELLTYEKKGSIEIANINKGGQKGSVVSSEGTHIGCLSATDYKLPKLVQIKSNTKQGFEIAKPGDSINISRVNSKTQRGKVGKSVAQTIDTTCQQAVYIGALRGRKTTNKKAENYTQTLEINKQGTSNTISTVEKDNVVISKNKTANYQIRRLTPRECLRLMGFPDTFKMPCSDTQMYKQAGNSIVVHKLAAIINNLINQ